MNKQELKAYAERFKQEKYNLDGAIIKLSQDEELKNLPNSTNRVAWEGVPWINYWRALTGNYSNGVTCACCGKLVYADLENPQWRDSIIKRKENENASSVDEYQAEGGHVVYSSEDEHLDGVYIVPLCRTCNHHTNQSVNIRQGSVLCPEVGQTVTEE